MLPTLHRFLDRYRADSEFQEEPAALIEVARAIVRHGGQQDRDLLAQLAARPHTLPALAEALGEMLAPQPTEGGAQPPELARTMTQEQLDQVMEGARDQIRPCIQAAIRRDSELGEIRMTLVVNGDGQLEELALTPNDDILGACLTLALVESPFPRSDLPAQRLEYSIGIQR
jgi:hypothetical protein